QMPPDRVLTHGAEGRGLDTVRGLRAPPHRAVLGIGAAKAVAEEAALAERGLDPLPDSGVFQEPPRHKAAKTDQAGVERLGAEGNDMGTRGRMPPVRADPEVAFGAGAVGKMRDDWPVGAILDAHQPLFEVNVDVFGRCLG